MKSSRPIVLVLMAHYLPSYKAGGPVRTIRNLVAALGDEFDFRIFTSDHEVGEREPFPGVEINYWNTVEGAQVFYADADARSPRRIAATINAVDPDIVYVNSFFNARFSIGPLALRRLGRLAPQAAWVLAPRGEFSRGAVALKALKKRLFIAAARVTGLHRSVIWQASSRYEADDIEREVGPPRGSIHVAPNLTSPVEPDLSPTGRRRDASRLSICFLARICEKKNLAFAIETLARCGCPADLHIHGPIEDEVYAAKCRDLVPRGESVLNVFWHGELPHEQVRSVLDDHDLFFLPTLGENFCHGVFEALAAGVPVLVSDRTPWQDLESEGVGWVVPLDDRESFVAAIKSLASMTPDARLAMRHRAHAYATRFAASSDACEANRKLFQAALDRTRLSAG